MKAIYWICTAITELVEWVKQRYPMIAIFIALCLLFWFLAYTSAKDVQKWEAFKLANQCKLTSSMTGEMLTTTTLNHKGEPMVSFTKMPDKECWLCADGVTYCR